MSEIAQKALADCGAASLCLAPWETPVCSRLFHGAKTFGDYISNITNEEKKETKKNSPGYLSLSCAPLGLKLGKCRLSLGLCDCGIKPTIAELNL